MDMREFVSLIVEKIEVDDYSVKHAGSASGAFLAWFF